MNDLSPHFLELIRHTTSTLPPDVVESLEAARAKEEPGSRAFRTFDLMLQNAAQANERSSPICQDTGTLIFYVEYGPEQKPWDLERDIHQAVREATAKSYLRPNSVDSVTGAPSKDNLGPGSPYIHFEPRKEKGLRVRLLMKGGGCENVGAQYSLPDESIAAGRDLDGVRRCIIDAVHKAQGYGCAPGTLGVGVGGDRVTSYMESKEQLFRLLGDENPDSKLAGLEKELSQSLNTLDIGPMGFGGKTTVLGVKIGARNRVPASFFVSVSYMCWAYRRGELLLNGKGASIGGRPFRPELPAKKSRVAARRGARRTQVPKSRRARRAGRR